MEKIDRKSSNIRLLRLSLVHNKLTTDSRDNRMQKKSGTRLLA
jgi:hypothetical protein